MPPRRRRPRIPQPPPGTPGTATVAGAAADTAAAAASITVAVTIAAGPADTAAAADGILVSRYVLPAVPPQPGPPLNGNPYFTAGSAAGWAAVNGTITATPSPPAGGPQPWAALYSNSGGTAGYAAESGAPFPVISGVSYLVTAWAYTTAPSMVIGLGWQDASHAPLTAATVTLTPPPGQWVQLATALTPPPGAAWGYPACGPSGTGTAAYITAAAVTIAGAATRIASPAFVRSAMPRMHAQNLLTGQWAHRDIQGITSPLVTWTLNGANTYTCTLTPPRADMTDASGNPVLQVWQTAIYLEEDDQIRWGGILTGQTMQGPSWTLSATGFTGYPAGMIYDGPAYSKTGVDALDVVRYIWGWLQSQPRGDLRLEVSPAKSGVLLGADTVTSAVTTLTADARPGDKRITVVSNAGFGANTVITVGGEKTAVIGGIQVPATQIPLRTALKSRHPAGAAVILPQPPAPLTLDWWNAADCGQEISSIQAEAVFDMVELHFWGDTARQTVRHALLFGVPRAGTRLTHLRFAEGENIIVPATVTQDGTQYANGIIGIGAGQGSGGIRSVVAEDDGRIRRVTAYTDATVTTTARMTAKARKVMTAMRSVDTVTQAIVRDHPNAPWGSFGPGDDILITLASGWRSAQIWSRITSMSQDPTTSLITLTLARSDSFTYLAESGQAGTL